MARTDGFRQQHVLLARHAAQVETMLPHLRGHEDWMRQALVLFASALTSHASQEDERLYPLLFKHPNAAVQASARALHAEFGVIYAAVEVFIAVWSREGALEAEPARFTAEAQGVITTLRARITREDSELYATIDAL